MCKHSKYDYPATPGTLPTGNPQNSCGNQDDGLWVEYNSVCYLFNQDAEIDFYTANDVCLFFVYNQ